MKSCSDGSISLSRKFSLPQSRYLRERSRLVVRAPNLAAQTENAHVYANVFSSSCRPFFFVSSRGKSVAMCPVRRRRRLSRWSRNSPIEYPSAKLSRNSSAFSRIRKRSGASAPSTRMGENCWRRFSSGWRISVLWYHPWRCLCSINFLTMTC